MAKMEEQRIFFKYDGEDDSIKNNQIDARLLASVLDNVADLISEADLALHEVESGVRVKAQAGFVKGSFGLELVVLADPAILKALGFVVSTGAGSLLSVLKGLKGGAVETIEIDEDSQLAKIIATKGETIEVPASVAKLIDSPKVRASIDKVIHQPLHREGISSFKVISAPTIQEADNHQETIFETNMESSRFFKKPATTQTTIKKDRETVATIEFRTANKDSGTSGWRMRYLSNDDLAVKIDDEVFLERIKNINAPKIFADKFKVELKISTTIKNDSVVSQSYRIIRVIGPVKK